MTVDSQIIIIKGENKLNNIVTNIFKSKTNSLNGVPITESNTPKKNSSFYDDYLKKSNQTKQETEFPLKIPALKMQELIPQATNNTSSFPKTSGSAIKKNIQGVLSKKYGELDTRNLFDGIDDKDVENNIETAESAIKTNLDSGTLNKSTLPKLPHLRDGLALSYAAANKGKSKAATKAREAAYMKFDEPIVKKTQTSMLSRELPNTQSTTPKTTVQTPSTATLMGNVGEETKPTNLVWKPNEKLIYNSKNPDFIDNIQKLNSTHLSSTDINFNNITQKPNKESQPLYSGNIWGNEPQEDLLANDIAHKDLYGFFTPSDDKDTAKFQKFIVPFIKDLRINVKDLLVPEIVHIQTFRSLGNVSSFTNKDMNKVANQLIDHFLSGTGNDFSSDEFTKAVGKHKETQRYMDDFTKTFKEELSKYNGSVSDILDSGKFHKALRKNGVLLTQYDYSDFKDLLGGYTFSVHSWTESDVSLKNLNINDDGTYKGVLEFSFKDNFGLDKNDLPPQYAAIPGFKSWFILQHSKKYNGKYKPFKTVVVLEKEFSGKL